MPHVSRPAALLPAIALSFRLMAPIPAVAPPLAAQTATARVDTTAYGALRWRNVGPERGGRSVAVAGSGARPQEYWMGTTGGGVFKTTDGGGSWAPVSDRYFGGTIGAIAVAESNPDVVYVGGGEYPIRGNVSHGDGVYKTTDGGRTWKYMGLVETRQIAKIRVHPKNPDVVYVAALGHVWGPNPERGIYRSLDGGQTWKKILFRNDSTGAIDLSMDPSDPSVLYAAFWQAYRTPWMLVSGGAGSGIFKSTDGGETWGEITRNPGLPRGLIGNIGISVSPAKSSVVYALIEADSGGVFRSGDAGKTWEKVNEERKLRQRAWYYTRIYADSRDSNVVYASNTSFQRSRDGGKTWTGIRTPHGDSHDMWIAPNDNQRMIEGNDGGGNVSFNGGRSWSPQTYLTAQFYHVTTTTHFPYRICGAQQDNSTVCGASKSDGGSSTQEWYPVSGGESGYLAVRPDNPDIIYGGSYGAYLSRMDIRTGLERNVNPWPLNPMGHSAGDYLYRFQWTFPIVISPHDPNVVYVGANVIFRSTDEGQSWAVISPDLTRNDPKTLGPSGGPITRDQTSVEYYGTVFTIAESPREKGVIWAGSDDGLVHVTRDHGKTWSNVTPKDMGDWTRISMIDASPHRNGTAYVAGNRFQLDDNAPYIWRTTDYGQTWTRITGGIRASDFVRVVREDPAKQGLLYAGTERGVLVSFDDGAHWQSLQLNLPPVPVHDLTVKEGDLVAASHGRAFWILDDLSVLRQATPAIVAADAHLYTPRDVYRIQGAGWTGATINYALRRGGQKVTIEFLDPKGAVIQTFTSDPDSTARAAEMREQARLDSLAALGVLPASAREDRAEAGGGGGFRGFGGGQSRQVPNRAGHNQFTWNLRYPEAVSFQGMIFWAGGTAGPVAPPGAYTVRFTVGDKTETAPLAVLKDPRSAASQADLDEQFRFLIEIRDKTSEANNAVRTIRNVKAQLADRQKRAGARGSALDRLAQGWTRELSTVEQEIYQVKNESNQDPLNFPIRLNNQIAAIAGVAGSTEAKPTAQSYEVFQLLAGQLDQQLATLRAALDRGLGPVNAELSRLQLPPITPSTEELKR